MVMNHRGLQGGEMTTPIFLVAVVMKTIGTTETIITDKAHIKYLMTLHHIDEIGVKVVGHREMIEAVLSDAIIMEDTALVDNIETLAPLVKQLLSFSPIACIAGCALL